jgi:hypothetical protein
VLVTALEEIAPLGVVMRHSDRHRLEDGKHGVGVSQQASETFPCSPDGSRVTVAIDWSFLGVAPVGQDLGHHLGCNIYNWAVDPRQAADHDATATRAYMRGLAELGWQGDPRPVLMARAAAAALQIGTFYAAHVAWLCPEMADPDAEAEVPWPDELARKHHMSLEAAISCWSAGFPYILDLGDEAHRRAEDIT